MGYLGASHLPYLMISQSKSQDYKTIDKQYRTIMSAISNTAVSSEPSDKFIIGEQIPDSPSHDSHLIDNYLSDEESSIGCV